MEETPMDVALFRKRKSGIIYEQLVEEIKFLILSSIKLKKKKKRVIDTSH